jgi:hypothetical protein
MANLKRSTKMAAKPVPKKAAAKSSAKDSGKPQSLIQMLKGRKSRLDKAIDG